MKCTACGHEFEGNFCPNCGKKSSGKRYTNRRIRTETTELFDIHEGFFKTIWDLFLKPGITIRGHLSGEVELFHPLKFLLIIGAISTYIMSTAWHSLLNQTPEGPFNLPDLYKLAEYNSYSANYLTFTNIVGIPLFTLVSYVVFKKHQLNLAEHLVLNVYLGAMQLLILILCTPFILLFSSKAILVGQIAFGLQGLYNIYLFLTFFKANKIIVLVQTVVFIFGGTVIAYFTNYGLFLIIPEKLLSLFEIF